MASKLGGRPHVASGIYTLKRKRLYVIFNNQLHSWYNNTAQSQALYIFVTYAALFLLTKMSYFSTALSMIRFKIKLIRINEKIVFCRHTHELEIMRTYDLYNVNSFIQFMCGSLSSTNHANDDNMFLYSENLSNDNMHLRIVRIFLGKGKVMFKKKPLNGIPLRGFTF